MKKFTMLFVLALFLKIAVGQVTVTITVKNNLSPITSVSGASVTLTGATTPTVISDANGLATFSVPTPAAQAFYNVVITAAGYIDYSNGYLVSIKPTDNNLTIAKTATIKKTFDITYKITDKNSVAISGASVRINTAPITTQTTDASGDVTFLGLYSVATHSTLVTANGYADSTFNVNITGSSTNPFVVPAVKLRNAYNINFMVTDGTNPVSGALVKIGTTTVTTDAAGMAAFTKKVNGTYAYSITKTGFIDKTGNVTVTDGDQTPAITLDSGYDITFTIINGASGTTGLQQDTITIDGITKISGTTGILTFGVAPGSSYSFDNKKAGFTTVPVAITNIQANTALTLNMVPVYSVKFTVQDSYTSAKIPGVKVTLNGTDILTDATGIAKFINVAPSATPLPYTITKPDGSTYISQTGTIQAPLTSTSYTSNNNNLSKSVYLDRPYIFISLTSGMMSYYGAATITFNGVDYAYDAGLAGNSFFVDPGTYSYTITPADINKAIISGSVTLTPTAAQSVYVNVVDGKKVEMYVTDATPDQNTIDGASVTLGGVTQTTVGGYVVFNRKAVNTSFPYTVSKAGYGTVTGTAAIVTADLVITSVLHTAYKVTATVYDNSNWPSVPLAGATVLFNGTSVVTDANGVAALPDAINGSYDYTVTKAGYVTVKGSAEVNNADLMFEAWLNPAFSVQFTVNDGTNPVANASVRLVSTWPVFDQTFVTNAQGVMLTDKLFPKWTSLEYTISAAGFADAMGAANMQDVDLVVDPISLKHSYDITFTVNDGTNPLMDASVIINNTIMATNASGIAVFPKMINGDYSYVVSKLGFGDVMGTVNVMDANAAKTVSLATGYNVTFNVINGPTGTTGLANDTITINGISKITDATGTVVFGVAPNAVISFVNKKAGFVSVPVDITSVTSDMTQAINMIPVYTVVFRAADNFSSNPISGATVIFNSTTVNTDVDGYAYFTNIAPSADPYAYSVSGNGSYSSVTGEVILPFTSTEDLLMNNNSIAVNAELSSPGVYMVLANGMMSYFGQATISFDGTDYQYDAGMGSAVINCSLGTHNYIVTPADITKAIVRGSVTVTSTVDKEFVEVQITGARKIEIYTVNAASDPITGASVTFAGTTVLTDATGLALFDRYPAGSYTYSVTMANYKSIDATILDVNTADVMKIVTMESLVYSVTFNVMSGTEILVGAVVTLDGVSVNTDASGNAVFTDLLPGEFTYSVSKAGYITKTGSVTVFDANVTENVTMMQATYSITFNVSDGTSAIANAIVTVGMTTVFTGADGKAVFTGLMPAVYNYMVTAGGYDTISSSVTVVDADIAENVTMKLTVYTLTFNVSDGAAAMAGADVTVGTTTIATGIDGKAVFTDLLPGNYNYSVSKTGYVTRTGSITITNIDVAESVTMILSTYAVLFNVTDGSAAIAGAEVKIGTSTVVTGADGKALFTGLLPGEYAYTVMASGYGHKAGSVTITDADVIMDLTLLSDVGLNLSRNGAINVYPNPTKGNLSVNLPANSGNGITISVTNAIGKVVLQKKVVDSSTGLDLDLSGFDNGVYFVKVIGSGFQNTVKVVKN